MPNAYIDPVLGSDWWDGLRWTPANEEYAKYKVVWLGAAYGTDQACGDVTATGITFEQQLEVYSGDILWMMNISDGDTYNPNPPLASATLGVTTVYKNAFMLTLKAAGTTAISDISSYTAPAAETDQSLDLAAPAGIQDNDIMIAMIMVGASTIPAITAPAGWALAGTLTPSGTRTSIYWKRCSSESGTYTWSHDKSTGPKIMGVITAYRNCITTGNPYDAVSATNYVTSNTTIRAAALTGGTKLAGPKATAASAETDFTFTGGDTVKFRGSYHSSATIGMTKGSQTLNLPANSVKLIDDCESGWTGATNITVGYSTTTSKIIGTNALKLTPAAGFLTGKMAYKTLASTLDLSAFKALGFWAYLPTCTTTEAYEIYLCSDANGDTPVATFSLNARSRFGFNN